VAPCTQNPSSLAAAALCRQTLKVGAGCGSAARPDLCGGRLVTAVPTANGRRPQGRREGLRPVRAKYEAKYDKAAACLAKNREALLAFYDFPAEHWKHIRTGNPIESTFATVLHRTTRAKGCLSHDTGMIMVFKLIFDAQSSWRRLDGQNQLPKVITGITFTDGIEASHENAVA